ncbi:MAG TPA: hypothetical protein VL442_01895 [Mucilaginibacter sp.]|jgi:hypothetical protein|nr:hypothetical protein [Mucilaginibacter sp.]
MKPNEPYSENREFYKRLLLVVVTALTTAIIYKALHSYSHQLRWALFMTQVERYEDTSTKKRPPVKEDSVSLTSGKIPASEFETKYSAESWYSEFESNQIAFNKNYNDKTIDVYGRIHDISKRFGCAQITMKGDESGIMQDITFSNCPAGDDHWTNEVLNVSVGQEVHIRGKYDGDGGYGMSLYDCHIIYDN